MNTQTPKSKELLQKVYDHLDTIDVAELSLRDLQDFLEVVQKGQFLESFGSTSALGFGGYPAFNSCAALSGTKSTDTADETAKKE